MGLVGPDCGLCRGLSWRMSRVALRISRVTGMSPAALFCFTGSDNEMLSSFLKKKLNSNLLWKKYNAFVHFLVLRFIFTKVTKKKTKSIKRNQGLLLYLQKIKDPSIFLFPSIGRRERSLPSSSSVNIAPPPCGHCVRSQSPPTSRLWGDTRLLTGEPQP